MSKIEVRASRFTNGELFPTARVHVSDFLPLSRALRSIKHSSWKRPLKGYVALVIR